MFSADDAVAMAGAGADVIVCHLGLTTGGDIGAETARTLDDSVALCNEWAAARQGRPRRRDRAVHGGPIAEPDDAAYVLQQTKGVHGFYGASSMERLPVERA